jgi:hypothetical protein
MSSKTNFTIAVALAMPLGLVLATASGALAAAKTHAAAPDQNVYNPAGAYVGTDPDPTIRFELKRDWERSR